MIFERRRSRIRIDIGNRIDISSIEKFIVMRYVQIRMCFKPVGRDSKAAFSASASGSRDVLFNFLEIVDKFVESGTWVHLFGRNCIRQSP